MKLKDILCLINGQIYTPNDVSNMEYKKAFSCDLMSDCLAFVNVNDKCILITGLINSQALRTAEMLDIDCIIFVRGKKPDQDMISLAEQNHTTLISTLLTMYETSGILYNAGLESLKL